MPQERYCNLVFQGGGVRGIAYAGVLAARPKHCRIHAVGGTSAGAIVAALLAVGTEGEELEGILRSRELFELLEETDVQRAARIALLWNNVSQVWAAAGEKLSMLDTARLYWQNRRALHDLRAVWTNRGLHASTAIRTWLDKVLGGKRFGDICVEDLRIVAADVSSREYVVFSKDRDRGRLIAEAVHASLSIPIFFEPFMSGPVHLVDGGILSNFPSFLFAQAKYPTIGFRLQDIAPAHQIDTTWDYLKGLALTMTEAHDKHRPKLPPSFKAYVITTPSHIRSTKFALDERDVGELYSIGRAVGGTVEWDTYSSPTPVVSFYDPRPDDTLQFSLEQAYRLWKRYADKEYWVDRMTDHAELRVHIERDWTARYDRYGAVEVGGSKVSFMSRFVAVATEETGFGPTSFMDFQHTCVEETSLGSRELIRIPAFNADDQKGFVMFYSPPIGEGQGVRRFHTGFVINREFEKSVALGEDGHVSYAMRQRAQSQELHLIFRIFVDVDLPALTFTPDFAAPVVEGTIEYDQARGRAYRQYECDAGVIDVVGEVSRRLSLKRTPEEP